MSMVKISKPEQFQHENNTWSRLLDFFKQENTFLKNRLAEVVDHRTDKEILALAEHFQNQFIIKDEFMDELRHDINEIDTVLKMPVGSVKIMLDKKTEAKQNKLRNEMAYLEKNFTQLKNEFNKYLVSVL